MTMFEAVLFIYMTLCSVSTTQMTTVCFFSHVTYSARFMKVLEHAALFRPDHLIASVYLLKYLYVYLCQRKHRAFMKIGLRFLDLALHLSHIFYKNKVSFVCPQSALIPATAGHT